MSTLTGLSVLPVEGGRGSDKNVCGGVVVVVVVATVDVVDCPGATGCVVVVVVVDVASVGTLIGDPASSVAPTGTRVLMKIAEMAAAAPIGAATHERQCLSAPRRMGISTRS
jgi:hypothetical protein